MALHGLGFENRIFQPQVRDGGWQPWAVLKDSFLKNQLELVTADVLADQLPVCEIHVNVHKKTTQNPAYLIAIEPPQILDKNYDVHYTKQFKAIFTWHDAMVDDKTYFKFQYPSPISLMPSVVDGTNARKNFSCIISGNKSTKKKDKDELYTERVKTIRWFEKNHPDEFKLYGVGWDIPQVQPGLRGKCTKHMRKFLARCFNLTPYPSYRGTVEQKSQVLCSTKFCFCYENVKNLPGYITEKIFDCFFSGCVPVYWGASNIHDYIPAECFVDRRNYNTLDELYCDLKNMSDQQYKMYQTNIVNFLQSPKAYPFSSESFAQTLVSKILEEAV